MQQGTTDELKADNPTFEEQLESARPLGRRFGLPLLVLLIGLATTAVVAVQFARVGTLRDEERLARLVDLRTDAVEDRLSGQVSILRGLAGYFTTAEEVTAEEFRTYVSRIDLERAYPGTQGVGYAEVVAADSPSGLTTRIVYLEPSNFRNDVALGYDMFSEEVRRAAMIAARDTGKPRMTAPVELVQEVTSNKEPGFLIYLPVYGRDEVPGTVDARREAFEGWVYSPFRAGDLFRRGILRNRPAREVSFRVFSGSDPDSLLFSYGTPREGAGAVTRTISVAGRDWLLVFRPTEQFRRASSPLAVGAIALVGLAITALLAKMTDLQAKAKAEAEETRDQLEEERSRLDALGASSSALAAELDLPRLVDLVCDRARRLTGASYGAFFEHSGAQGEDAEWHLFNLSGGERSGVGTSDIPEGTGLLRTCFDERRSVVIDDIAADPRFAGEGGAAAARTSMRSHLCVPVISRSGTVLGALLFGHPRPGKFTEKDALLISAFAAQAAIALDNANLFQSANDEIELRRATEEELIEARRRAESESSQSRAILTQLGEGVIVTDAEGQITFVNEAAEELHGRVKLDVPPEEYADSYKLKTLEGEPYPSGELPLARAVQRGETVADERWRIERPDGTEVIAVGSASPVLLADGSLIGAVVTMRDDTSRHHYEEALERLNEVLEEKVIDRTRELEEAQNKLQRINRNLEGLVERRVADVKAANEEIQRFAYIVSHDLRSPLVNIMGFTAELEAVLGEIMAKVEDAGDAASLKEDAQESIGFIKSAISKMDGLIGAILKLSRAGQRTYNFEPLDVTALVQDAADAQQHQADSAGAEVVIEALPSITSDRLALEQIFGNLIDNALKYLAHDRPGRIRVTGSELETEVRYEISDNGRGISDADQSRIFDLFRRAGKQDRAGEGIGLAYVRMLVRALGGTIGLRSALGEGTTFVVTLPVEPPQTSEKEALS